MPETRIISLIASSTEIVCALGFEAQLVGRSHECDYPPSVKALPQCTAPKFKLDGTSYEIDQRVKAIVQEALSVYRVDAHLLEELNPTHIITQSQCAVCAVSINDVEKAVCEITSSRPVIVSLEPNSLQDIWHDIKRVGLALGVPDRAESLVAELRMRMETVVQAADGLHHRPTVACIEWIDPLMAAGNWMPELVTMAGGINLFGLAGQHSPWMCWDQLIERDPEVIVVTPCGFDIGRTRQEKSLLSERSGWADLAAVRSGRVYIADGNQYFNRPGPRVVESLEILSEILHPEAFRFGHQGVGWVRLD